MYRIIFMLQEVDLLDIATIRDTRTGRHAKIPKVSPPVELSFFSSFTAVAVSCSLYVDRMYYAIRQMDGTDAIGE